MRTNRSARRTPVDPAGGDPSRVTTLGISRRSFVAGSLVALVGLGLAGCGGSQPVQLDESSATTAATSEAVTVRVASLKGPTSIGLVQFMDQAKSGKTANAYEFSISGSPDEVTPKVISGDADIALVPSNVASVLYNKTKGAVEVIDINTLGVLNVVTGDAGVKTFDDLAGKTVYLTGKGATPEYSMNYLLDQAGIKDKVTLEFKSEATEVVSVLASDPAAVGILPEPFKTAALAKSPALASPVDLTDVWDEFAGESGSRLITGVTVARKGFAKEHSEALWEFLSGHNASVDAVNGDPAGWSQAVVDADIVDNAKVAEKAIPGCHIVCTTGEEMKKALSGYLQVLFDADASSVGGAMPADDFYYEQQGA